jgi:hypothetical protein
MPRLSAAAYLEGHDLGSSSVAERCDITFRRDGRECRPAALIAHSTSVRAAAHARPSMCW